MPDQRGAVRTIFSEFAHRKEANIGKGRVQSGCTVAFGYDNPVAVFCPWLFRVDVGNAVVEHSEDIDAAKRRADVGFLCAMSHSQHVTSNGIG